MRLLFLFDTNLSTSCSQLAAIPSLRPQVSGQAYFITQSWNFLLLLSNDIPKFYNPEFVAYDQLSRTVGGWSDK